MSCSTSIYLDLRHRPKSVVFIKQSIHMIGETLIEVFFNELCLLRKISHFTENQWRPNSFLFLNVHKKKNRTTTHPIQRPTPTGTLSDIFNKLLPRKRLTNEMCTCRYLHVFCYLFGILIMLICNVVCLSGSVS